MFLSLKYSSHVEIFITVFRSFDHVKFFEKNLSSEYLQIDKLGLS